MPRAFSSGRRSVSTPVSALHQRGLAVVDVAGGADDHAGLSARRFARNAASSLQAAQVEHERARPRCGRSPDGGSARSRGGERAAGVARRGGARGRRSAASRPAARRCRSGSRSGRTSTRQRRQRASATRGASRARQRRDLGLGPRQQPQRRQPLGQPVGIAVEPQRRLERREAHLVDAQRALHRVAVDRARSGPRGRR